MLLESGVGPGSSSGREWGEGEKGVGFWSRGRKSSEAVFSQLLILYAFL